MLKFIMYYKDRYVLPAVNRKKITIQIQDLQHCSLSNTDRQMNEEHMKLTDAHFPCLFDRMGTYGVPFLLSPLAKLFIKYSVSESIRRRHRFYNNNNIVTAFDNRKDLVPIELGEQLPLEPVFHATDIKEGWLTIREYGYQHDFQIWEISKMEDLYGIKK